MIEQPAEAVNFQSLNIVREELVATIEDAARSLERFVTIPDEEESLQQCVDLIAQIVGILSLLNFEGAKMLAEELLLNSKEISPGNEGRLYEKRLEVISSSFFALTRYLEYVQQHEHRAPVLLIPQINELRKLMGKPSIPESHFFEFNESAAIELGSVEPLGIGEQGFLSTLKRLRHMYQIGLLGYIRESNTDNSLALMRRSMIKINRLVGSQHPLSLVWWLSNICLAALASRNMVPIETRKNLFARIDRIIAQVEKNKEKALATEPPSGLVKELVYLIALSGIETEDTAVIFQAYKVGMFPYTDDDLEKERRLLNGPSAHTIASLAKVLQAELATTKKVLENASQASVQEIDDIGTFIATLQKIAEILAIVGLSSPSATLKDEVKRIEGWRSEGSELGLVEMQEIANTLLYIESTLGDLSQANLSNEKLELANRVAQEQVVAKGQLAEAKKIVVEEALAGISLTKRALSSFSEADYDVDHIRNIVKSLDSIRGGMVMLNNDLAENVLVKCSEFVNEILLGNQPQPALKELLETFADAIISIEYYLNSATPVMQMDDAVLKIAEESLEALGFPVDQV